MSLFFRDVDRFKPSIFNGIKLYDIEDEKNQLILETKSLVP